MCLPNFIKFEQIEESNSIIGYRDWKNRKETLTLRSQSVDYIWLPEYEKISHKVTEKNSGIYAYNYYNNDYYNNYGNYYSNHYYLHGIIKQWGKVAIHEKGQRSEYAKIDTLFKIRKSDAKETKEFLDWIDEFNEHIEKIAKVYNVKNIINWQDFKDSNFPK